MITPHDVETTLDGLQLSYRRCDGDRFDLLCDEHLVTIVCAGPVLDFHADVAVELPEQRPVLLSTLNDWNRRCRWPKLCVGDERLLAQSAYFVAGHVDSATLREWVLVFLCSLAKCSRYLREQFEFWALAATLETDDG